MTVGVAVVGYGSAGKQHIQAINFSKTTSLRGVFDLDASLKLNNIPQYLSWQELLNDPKVDVIALCIQPYGKLTMAMEAMEFGKDVLMEKPPCLTEKELDILLETSYKTDQNIGVMFQHRYQLPEEILNWDWGPETIGVLEVSRPREFVSYFQSWRQNKEQSGGGILAHLGVHYLDLATLLLGEPISFLHSGKRNVYPGIDVRSTALIEFSNGSVLTVAITGESSARNERLVIYGKNKSLSITNGNITYQYDDNEYIKKALNTRDLRIQLYEDFVSSSSQKRCNLYDSRGVIKALESFASFKGVLI